MHKLQGCVYNEFMVYMWYAQSSLRLQKVCKRGLKGFTKEFTVPWRKLVSNTSGYQASLVECSLKFMPSFDSADLNIWTDFVVTLPFLEGHSLRGCDP